MTAERPDDVLQRIAGIMSDGDSVDWNAESQAHADLAASIRILEKISEITALAAAPLAFGSWGHLQIVAKIGTGSCGDVYWAFNPRTQTDVALKLWMRRQPWSVPSHEFLRQARRLARVSHVNVLRTYDAAIHNDVAGAWSELLEGVTLEELLRTSGPLDAKDAADIALQLCRALAAIHSAGLVHCDVTTTNVMREAGGRIVLMELGSPGPMSKDDLDAMFGTTRTPLTMAPECLNGEAARPVSDVYSLGVLVYRLVTGKYPVEAASLAGLIEKHAGGGGVPLQDRRPDLPRDFVRWVQRAIDPDPSKRFPSAGAMERGARLLVARRQHGARPSKLLVVLTLAIVALTLTVLLVAHRFGRER